MAWDSAMLAAGHARGDAYWRMYGWTEPAFTFGYSQRWEQVIRDIHPFGGTVLRRITGGGIVDHRHDLTYALTLPSGHPFHRVPALDLYREFHARIIEVLLETGFDAVQAPCPGRGDARPAKSAGVCFQRAEPYDIVDPSSGRKLAGAAMKRSAQGILIQGSMDARLLKSPDSDAFCTALSGRLAEWLNLGQPARAQALPQSHIEEAADRFSSLKWNRRR